MRRHYSGSAKLPNIKKAGSAPGRERRKEENKGRNERKRKKVRKQEIQKENKRNIFSVRINPGYGHERIFFAFLETYFIARQTSNLEVGLARKESKKVTKQAVKKYKYISEPLSMDKGRRSGRLYQTNQNWNEKLKQRKEFLDKGCL